MDRAEVIERVRKCWTLAEDTGATEGEREAAIEMARKLMAKFQIDEIVLQEKSGGREDVVMKSFRITTEKIDGMVKGLVPDQRISLANYIARTNRCRAVIERRPFSANVSTGKPIPGGKFITIAGFKSDTEMVEELYLALSVDMLERLLGEQVQTTNYQVNFADGYGMRMYERLMDISRTVEKSNVETEHGSMALVLRDRSAAVDDFFTKMFPKLGKAYQTSFKYDRNAQERGRQAADKAVIGDKGKVGGGERKAIR